MQNEAGSAILIGSVATASLLAVTGTIVGYELWDESQRGSLRVTPSASASAHGFTLGANGSF
jgi:hypothetical protein